MAVYINYGDKDETIYHGCVINWYERNGYYDSDFYAEVWDEETQSIKTVEFDSTRHGGYGNAKLDATDEVLRKVYRQKKQLAAAIVDRKSVEDAKKIRKGDTVRIIKGRKVKKGLEVPVFWAGIRHNPYSRKDEARIGVEVDGERVFIAAENAEPVNWEDRVLHGWERKEAIREKALRLMPVAYRYYFKGVRKPVGSAH